MAAEEMVNYRTKECSNRAAYGCSVYQNETMKDAKKVRVEKKVVAVSDSEKFPKGL